MRYRKNPVEIDAEEWFPDTPVDGVEFPALNLRDTVDENHGIINTLEGKQIVLPGDWIITGVKGEKFLCKPDIFEMTYEKVEADQ